LLHPDSCSDYRSVRSGGSLAQTADVATDEDAACIAARNPLAATGNLVQPEYSGSVLGSFDASNKQPAVNDAARCGRTTMSSDAASLAGEQVGPLERKHLQHTNYRAVADGVKVSRTHWHIATANALGWGFDGMDGVIFALVSPMVIKEFSLTVPEYRSGLRSRFLSESPACISGHGSPTVSGGARCSPSTSRCSHC
jgi:hypothetical protein